MGAQLGGKGIMAEMNLTPLIDIVLVVLIIMMVSIPIQIEKMGVKLPSRLEVKTKQDVPVEQLVIAVYAAETEGGTDFPLALNRKLTSEGDIFFEITRRLRNMEKKAVFIDAHPDVPYGRVVDMMDLAREAGAEKVGLARLKELGPAAWTSVATGARPRGVILGNPVAVGPISAKSADKAIQEHKGLLMACYKKGLAENADLTGRVMIRIGVGPEGEHMSEKIAQSNLENETVETCIEEQVIPLITFKPLGEQQTAIVQYPVVFSPG